MRKLLPIVLVLLLSAAVAMAQDASTSGNLTGNGQSVVLDLDGFGTAAFQFTGTWVATVQFEATVDGTNWFPVNVFRVSDFTAVTSTTANGEWMTGVAGYQRVRARTSAYTSGTAVINIRAAAQSQPIPVSTPSTVTVDNGAGGAAVNVQDGGNSLTVDIPDVVANATLDTLNETVTVATGGGRRSVGFVLRPTAFQGTLRFEQTITGSDWEPAYALDVTGDAGGTETWIFEITNPNTQNAEFVALLGAYEVQYRVRVSAYTSGTVDVYMVSSTTASLFSLDAATDGFRPFMSRSVGGRDGGSLFRDHQMRNAAPAAGDYGLVTRPVGFPAAAALADNTANPTLTKVQVFPMLWDGANWDRPRGDSSNGAMVQGSVLFGDSFLGNEGLYPMGGRNEVDLFVIPFVRASVPTATDDGLVTRLVGLPETATLADNMANPNLTQIQTFNMVWDGVNWDRQRPIPENGFGVLTSSNDTASSFVYTAATGPVSNTLTILDGLNTVGVQLTNTGPITGTVTHTLEVSVGGTAFKAVQCWSPSTGQFVSSLTGADSQVFCPLGGADKFQVTTTGGTTGTMTIDLRAGQGMHTLATRVNTGIAEGTASTGNDQNLFPAAGQDQTTGAWRSVSVVDGGSAPNGTTSRALITHQVGFPSAAALADNTANPTLTKVQTFQMVWDGSTWDRWNGGVTVNNVALGVVGISADGAAVLGAPVRIGGKDGSGNTQDIITDTDGHLQVDVLSAPTTTVTATDLDTRNLGAATDSVTAVVADDVGNLIPSSTTSPAVSARGMNMRQVHADPCKTGIATPLPISVTADTQLVAAVASQHVYVCQINLVVAAATNVAITSGTGTVCATSEAGVFGGNTAATGWHFAANGGIVLGTGDRTIGRTETAADALCINVSAANQVSGSIMYVQQ